MAKGLDISMPSLDERLEMQAESMARDIIEDDPRVKRAQKRLSKSILARLKAEAAAQRKRGSL